MEELPRLLPDYIEVHMSEGPRMSDVELKGNDDLLNFSRHSLLFGLAHTSEHLFQALKATNSRDFHYVLEAASPEIAKDRGREIELREDWDKVKWSIMVAVLILKMHAHTSLRSRLMKTKNRDIVEARRDPIWGKGGDGKGANLMGLALMMAREVIRMGAKNGG